MLSGYSEAVANAEAFQRKFGITLTDTETNAIERANDAVGRISMVFEGLGNRLAVIVAPALEEAANGFISLAGAIFGVRGATEELGNYMDVLDEFGNTERVAAMLGGWQQFTDAIKAPGALEALDDLGDAYSRFFDAVGAATPAAANDMLRLTEHSEALGAGIMMLKDRAQGLALELQNAINEGRVEDASRLRDELEATVEQLQLSLQGAQNLSGLDLSGAIGWANSLAGAFGAVATAAANAASAAASIPGATPYSGPVSSGRGGAGGPLVGSPELAELQAGGGVIRNMPAAVSGGGGGGGGGLEDQLKDRLETLMEGLQTEAETVALWYEEQQMTLEEALAAKMLTEAEYMDARERLEREHQDRLSGIREMANQSNLQMVLGAGEEILSAIGQSNKKAMKVAKVFGAAQALISTYQGAAEALKLPFPKNLAAAAAVIAKGIGFVNAIKSVNESGGGGGGGRGGGGGSSGGGGTAAQQNLQTFNFSIVNDSFGIGENIIRQIAGQLNQASRNGTVIRANVVT
jgi:hypothetical protein